MMAKNDAGRQLTICGIGASASSHVVSRLRCFAALGHRVYLVDSEDRQIEGLEVIVPPVRLCQESRVIAGLDRLSRRWLRRRLPGLTTLSLLLLPLIIRHLSADLVHIHYAYSYWAWMAATLTRLPIVVSVMGGDILFDEQGRPTARGRRLTLALLGRASLVTAKSEHLRHELIRLGLAEERTMTLKWGVDRQLFQRRETSELRRDLGLAPSQPVIFSPRMMQPFYNIELLIEAMPHVLGQHPAAVLLLSEHQADAQYRRQLVALISRLDLTNNVKLIGDLKHEEMALWYSLATVAIAIPPSDGLPQSLLEAMACETPNILSRLARYNETVEHGVSAWMVELTPPAIATGISRLLADQQLCFELCKNGLAIVDRLSTFESEVLRVASAYEKMLTEEPPRLGWLERQRQRIGTILEFMS
ncbi:MAG: glycosyltransferase family 4 protein [Acidobacteriota bacterium]